MTLLQFAIAREYANLNKESKRRQLTEAEQERLNVLIECVIRDSEAEAAKP